MDLITPMHWTHHRYRPYGGAMRANDFRSNDAFRHGAYLCFRAPPEPFDPTTLAERCGLTNEFAASGEHPEHAIAFLRRVSASSGSRDDDALLHADAIVHVASSDAARV